MNRCVVWPSPEADILGAVGVTLRGSLGWPRARIHGEDDLECRPSPFCNLAWGPQLLATGWCRRCLRQGCGLWSGDRARSLPSGTHWSDDIIIITTTYKTPYTRHMIDTLDAVRSERLLSQLSSSQTYTHSLYTTRRNNSVYVGRRNSAWSQDD